ncbi:hypothetical protein SB689_16265, partial [Chryseobacterium sp. SIMBA_038]
MKKTLALAILFTWVLSFGQIGIGTPSPRGALDINKPTTNNMGLVLPTNSDVNNILNPLGGDVIPGTIIYDSTNDCVRLYQGTNRWSNCLSDTTCEPEEPTLSLDCTKPTVKGQLIAGVQAAGQGFTISYTGGDGSAHNGQVVQSTGVTGLTATLAPGNFSNGNGNLIYTITGTPSSEGTASFDINIGGQTCTVRIVVDPQVPGSIGDLQCGNAIHNGTLAVGTPAASNVNTKIPYTSGNGGPYAGEVVPSFGITGLTATLLPGNFENGNGTITYTITGTPSSYGTAIFPINVNGNTCTFYRTIESSAFTLDCSSAEVNGVINSGASATNAWFRIYYNGGDGSNYPGETVQSTGVTGLTATLVPGTFNNGFGGVIYQITGTPNQSGTAYLKININGKICNVPVNVREGVTIGTIASLDCNGATHTGTLTNGVAASNVQSVISYTGGNGGAHNGQTVTSTGVTGLTATLAAGNFNNGNGDLTYTITGTP